MNLLKLRAPVQSAGMYRNLTTVISLLLFFALLINPLNSKANVISCNSLLRSHHLLTASAPTEDRTLAVHLTNYFPKDGFIRASTENSGRFAPTLHFALGQPVIDHAFGKWSQKRYGVLLPLGAMRTQILNLFPQDTFVLGDVKLPPETIIFVPKGEKFPQGLPFKIRQYNVDLGIKIAIEEYIQSSGSLVFKAPRPFSSESLFINGKEIPDGDVGLRTLFKEFFDKNIEVTSTTHDYTPWGKIDYGIIDLLGRWLRDSTPLELKSSRFILDTLSIQDSLLEVHRIYKKKKLSEDAQRSFLGHLENLRKYLNLLQVDVELRKIAKSVLATDLRSDPTFKSEILTTLANRVNLKKLLIANMDRLANIDRHELVFTPRDLFSIMKFSGLDRFQKKLSEEFPKPSPKEKSEIDLVMIWKASQLLCQNKVSADVALNYWRQRIGNVNETSIKINVIDNMMKILFKNGKGGITKDIIRFFNDPLIRRIFDQDLYYSHHQNDPEVIAVLDKILEK